MDDLSESFPPLNDVMACRADLALQRQHAVAEARHAYLGSARPCPNCGKKADDLEWFWFRSPPETWEMLAGRAGWMTFCPVDEARIDFFMEVMN